MAKVDKARRKVAKLGPLKLTIPARLRPHIRSSFSAMLGYSERDAVIYLIQKSLEDEMMKDTTGKLSETMRLLKEP